MAGTTPKDRVRALLESGLDPVSIRRSDLEALWAFVVAANMAKEEFPLALDSLLKARSALIEPAG